MTRIIQCDACMKAMAEPVKTVTFIWDVKDLCDPCYDDLAALWKRWARLRSRGARWILKDDGMGPREEYPPQRG